MMGSARRWVWVALVFGLGACGDGEAQAPALEALDGVYDEAGPGLARGVDGKGDDLLASIPAYGPMPEQWSAQPKLQALFAPQDPVATIEQTLVQRVIDARAADPAQYVEGENPYQIRYAVYNLRNPELVELLAQAHERGVDVQILVEADQLDPAKDYNTADETLVARGFELVESHKLLDAQLKKTADLIGVASSGLMHLKTRLFITPSERLLLTGSLNPGDNAMLNEESLHLISDAAIVGKYMASFEAVRDGERLGNTWDEGAALNVMFTPAWSGPRAVTKVFDWLEQEQEQILLMVFSLRDISAPEHEDTLVELLGRKVAQGVPVYVITDRKQSDGVDANGVKFAWNDNTEDRLRALGVRVYEATNRATEFTAMHHKVAVLGRSRIRVITDAANWTKAGLGTSTKRATNVESQLFIDSAALDDNLTGKRYLAQFMDVLSRYASQTPEEPSFEQVFFALSEASSWPTIPVEIMVDGAYTQWGEHVNVVGALSSLGAWGEVHPGLRMTTDGQRYPTWWLAQPLVMPVGAALEFKFTKNKSGGQVSWERGEDREGFVRPAALDVQGRYVYQGLWR